MKNIKKLTVAAFLVAICVVMSPFSIPVGFAKCFPIQHIVNVIAGVTLGPLYAVMMAFCISFIRIMLGTASLLAFPGSMIGALLAGLFYKRFNKLIFAYIGEVFGTGIIGSLVAYPVAAFIMGKKTSLFTYVIPFLVSTVIGALVAICLIKVLEKTNVLNNSLEKIK